MINILRNVQVPLKTETFDTYTTKGRSAGNPLDLMQVHWFGQGKKSPESTGKQRNAWEKS